MAGEGDSPRQDEHLPKVSILLPNLNTLPFLEERVQTIRDQTLTDWELIIVDNYSDDGAWEYFQECARDDARIYISQAPREGMYANWNNCISLARGEYVYIATSDDTMMPDCLEKMVAALEEHTDCGIAICGLQIIDENGNEINVGWQIYGGNLVLGERLKSMHVRNPPYDTIVSCAYDNTFTSITQLLVRKSSLDKIGFFRTDFGSWGDVEWGIRSSLLTPRVHVPEKLATWRRTPGQATQDWTFTTVNWHRKAVEMTRFAYLTARDIDPDSTKSVPLGDLLLPQSQEVIKTTLGECTNRLQKFVKISALFIEFPYATITYIAYRITDQGGPFGVSVEQARKHLSRVYGTKAMEKSVS